MEERRGKDLIDQRLCKYIKTIAQYHSFSRAAQVLYISQPALSRFVKKVEDELGVALFDRDTMPLGLTPAGKRYLEYVESFQKLEGEMRAEFAAMGKGAFTRLTVATLPLLGIYVLPKIIPDFAEQYPSVDQRIEECSSLEILKRLEEGEADLALTNLKPDSELLLAEGLQPNRPRAATPAAPNVAPLSRLRREMPFLSSSIVPSYRIYASDPLPDTQRNA